LAVEGRGKQLGSLLGMRRQGCDNNAAELGPLAYRLATFPGRARLLRGDIRAGRSLAVIEDRPAPASYGMLGS
jgi:hypothetical protein